jgi:phosphoenolpyruvate carboxylase
LVNPEYQHVAKTLDDRMELCLSNILEVVGNTVLLKHDPVVARAITGRLPYTNILNLIQVEMLETLRKGCSDELKQILDDNMVVTIQGIASGMGTTG